MAGSVLMTFHRVVLIYNPAAGWGARRQERLRQVVDALRKQVGNIETQPTVGPGSATELAKDACQSGADLVVALGGDGTINEVVNGMAHTAVPLAVLPAGTANVLALELGLGTNPVRAAAFVGRLEPRRISLGRVRFSDETSTCRYWVLMAGAGLDAQIVYNLNMALKWRTGVLAYWVAGLPELRRRRIPFEVDVAGKTFECTFALASHVGFYGGRMRLARKADLLADDLEVVLFHSRSSLRYLVYFAAVLTRSHHRLRDVSFLRARRLLLRAPRGSRVRLQADGELLGWLPATVEIVPDALTLLMPRSYIQAHG